MITGYNTDVEHDGVVYHVQTEDKGLESPIVLSLVYSGGAILAAKRSPYADLIANGFDEAALAERLRRQHHLICAAIHAGRIEELRKLSKPQTGRLTPETVTSANPDVIPDVGATDPLPVHAVSIAKESEEPETTVRQHSAPLVEPPATPVVHVQPAEPQTGSLIGSDRAIAPSLSGANTTNRSAYTVYDSRRRSRTGEVIKEPDGLRITMLGYDPDFRGGQHIELKAIVTRISEGVEEPLVGALISVKILGTTFRPVLFSLKTDREGLMNVSTRIPAFASGRAAIVVKAATGDLVTEARWVVHPGK